MFKAVIYVETNSTVCRGLSVKVPLILKCTMGSKERAMKKYGFPDDDYDFAHRFVSTCKAYRPSDCVAVVRDPRIVRFIWLLRDRMEVFNTPIRVIRTDRFCMTNDTMKYFLLKNLSEYLEGKVS